jgi:hypothetical protein
MGRIGCYCSISNCSRALLDQRRGSVLILVQPPAYESNCFGHRTWLPDRNRSDREELIDEP